jgi:hypothetical protein
MAHIPFYPELVGRELTGVLGTGGRALRGVDNVTLFTTSVCRHYCHLFGGSVTGRPVQKYVARTKSA